MFPLVGDARRKLDKMTCAWNAGATCAPSLVWTGGSMKSCNGLHHFISYPAEERQKLADIVKLQPPTLGLYRVLVGHRYIVHAGVEYLWCPSLRYHLYLSPSGISLKDNTFNSYNWSISTSRLEEGNRADKAPTETSNADVINTVAVVIYRKDSHAVKSVRF